MPIRETCCLPSTHESRILNVDLQACRREGKLTSRSADGRPRNKPGAKTAVRFSAESANLEDLACQD